MIKISNELKNLIESRECMPIPVVEFYYRDVEDISSNSAPANAFGRFSDTCFTWYNDSGSYEYKAKIISFPSVKIFLENEVNEATIELSNVEKGENSAIRFILDNKIKGSWMVIRLVFPELPNESWVIWWGKCVRPGRINDQSILISATQDLGNYKTQVPFRTYGIRCPLTPGKGDCLGNIPLESHSSLYQQQYAQYGTMLCPDRTRSTCVKLGNEVNFQGQSSVAITGTFSYISTEEVDLQSQNKKKKSNLPNIKTESWSAVNQSETTSEIVNLALGRCQIAGHPFLWADTGTEIKSLQGFAEGKINGFYHIRCRNRNFRLGTVIQHLGDYGNTGTQQPDSLFNGFSGFNSRLAYLEVVVTGSNPDSVDGAPLITSVIKGLEVPLPDINDEYKLIGWTDNPVHIIRYLLTDQKFGRIPSYRIADKNNKRTADYCDELVEDRTQCENIVLPLNEYNDYGQNYRRFSSTSATRVVNIRNEILNPSNYVDPVLAEPYIQWYNPFSNPPIIKEKNILRRRFTINGALQEKTSLLDFINKRLLPCFRGWLNYNRDGQIEIRTREPADISYLRADIEKDTSILPINNIKQWRENIDGYLLIGVGLEKSEIRKVTGILYSPGCNQLPISVNILNGSITSTVLPISGGSYSSQGVGYIELNGEVTPDCELKFTFNNVPNDFFISYFTDGSESIEVVARMIMAHFNANPDFSNYLTAYINPNFPNRIYIQCEAGFLQLDKELEYTHSLGEQVMRVDAVFENCNELGADESSNFDNIIVNSFSWNEADSEEINSYTALFTSAVDDFHVARIIPRKSWDTIEFEGELNEQELDLKFVDNYWQAAYVTKTTAIENIDGNLPFRWNTGISGFMLEMGDVVAVRHDSGDGAIRYTPVWINNISYDIKSLTTSIEARLYLSAAWDSRVQKIDAFLTTTMNPDYVPGPISPTGGHGGYSLSSEPTPFNHPRFENFRESRYSPDGLDLI